VAWSTVAIAAPGLLFTLITQVHWIINRRRIMNPPVAPATAADPEQEPVARSRRASRRRRRRR